MKGSSGRARSPRTARSCSPTSAPSTRQPARPVRHATRTRARHPPGKRRRPGG